MPKTTWQPLLTLSAILILWKLASTATNPLTLPPPEAVVTSLTLILISGESWQMLANTAGRALTGMLAAVITGVIAGLVLTPLTPYIRPAVTALQNIPLVSWILLAIIWFGFTDANVSFVVFIATFPVIYLNAVSGALNIDPQLLEMAKNLRIPNSLKWYGISLPSVATHISAGISVAIAIMWKSVVMAELFASSPGIGTQMEISRTYLQTDKLMAWTLLLVMLGLSSEFTWRLLIRTGMMGKAYRWALDWFPVSALVDEIQATGPFLRFTDVSKHFGQGTQNIQILKNISLQLKPGETVFLTGPSGAGKTTLLRIMANLEGPDDGIITRNGTYPCMMFQEHRLLPWFTAEENIIFALRSRMDVKEARSKARAMLDQLHIPSHFYPHQLSGGMKKAVSLARTLAVKSNVILLDEPFASSDPGQKDRMKKAITKAIRPTDILLIVTHKKEDVIFPADRILKLEGRPATLTDEYDQRKTSR